MPWTKGKIEKAWRIFDKSMGVIADALEVPVDELRAMLLDGTLPTIEDPAANMEAPGDTMEADSHVKRATLADLAPPAPETVLEQAATIIEKPLTFRPAPKPAAYVPAVSRPASNAVKAVDTMIGESLDDRPLPARRSNLASSADTKRRAHQPVEFFLMHEGRYLHESCTGLTDKREHAWRQPEGKIAAVRRKFPETVDYTEVPAK